MNIRTILSVTAVAAILGLALGVAPQSSSQTPPAPRAAFDVDAVHSSLIFKIRHMDVANFYGRFNTISGSYTLDEAKPENCAFQFEVKADSIDTGNQRRDGHLKSPDFFNVAEYPTITFKSTEVARKGEHQLSVTGDLSLHGVTKPITADVQIFPAKETQQGVKGGFEARFTIKRSDHEMNYGIANNGLGDEVEVIVAVEGARK